MTRARRLPIALACAAVFSAALQGQVSHCDAGGADYVEPTLLEKPVPLREGIGKVSQKVTAKTPQAQVFCDQGLALLHSYAWIEAARAFHQALRSDPDCAMAWMGLARAEQGLERKASARAAIQKAVALAPKATAKERLFIALRAEQMDAAEAVAQEREKHEAYKRAIDNAIAGDPADAELWILRGNAEEPGAWGRGQVGGVGSVAYYETALARDPGHFGAHHYLVHSYENIGRHAEAAAHGKIYADAAPAVAHAQHMYAHVLPRLARWKEALVQLERADEIEEAYARAEKVRPGDDWHHLHNLQLLSFTYLRLARYEDAEKTLRRAYAVPGRTPMGDFTHISLPEFLLLRGRAAEALTAARGIDTASVAARAAASAIEAEILLAMGRLEEARVAARRASEAYAQGRKLPGREALYFERFIGPPVERIEAELALRGDDPASGERRLRKIADDLVANPRFDAWGEGLFQLERAAESARRAGKPELAKDLADRMRRIDPDYVPGSSTRPIEDVRNRAAAALPR